MDLCQKECQLIGLCCYCFSILYHWHFNLLFSNYKLRFPNKCQEKMKPKQNPCFKIDKLIPNINISNTFEGLFRDRQNIPSINIVLRNKRGAMTFTHYLFTSWHLKKCTISIINNTAYGNSHYPWTLQRRLGLGYGV